MIELYDESLELNFHRLTREDVQADPENNQSDNSYAKAHRCNSGARTEQSG